MQSNRNESDGILDLRWRADLTPETGRDYDDVADEIRAEFTECIGKCSEDHKDNIDWWVETPSSRNQTTSRLFHFCVALDLINKRQTPGPAIDKILVDSPAFKRLLDGFFESAPVSPRICLTPGRLLRTWKIIRRSLSPLRTFVRILGETLAVRLAGQSKPFPDAAVVLLDCYFLPSHTTEDRYYQGLWDCVREKDKQYVWYVPQFVGFSLVRLFRTRRRLQRHEKNYVFREDYLTISDYLYCLGHWARVRRIDTTGYCFRNHDISALVREELRLNADPRSVFLALLNARFAVRLRENGIRLRRIIDWYENQPVDRGWNSGFRRSYPGVPLIGYQGTHAAYQSIKPARHEYEAGILPDVIAVMGAGFFEDRREFFPDMPMSEAPAFRYQQLWQKSHVPARQYDQVLVALPMDEATCNYVLRLVIEASTTLADVTFLVKSHPVYPISDLPAQHPEYGRIKLVTGMLSDWFPKVSVAICGGITTAGLEAIASGCPAILVSPPGRRSEIPIPQGLSKTTWRISQDLPSLLNALSDFQTIMAKDPAKFHVLGEQVRKKYFQAVNTQTVSAFLGLNGPEPVQDATL